MAKILVVDDSKLTRMILVNTLQEGGFTVIQAENAKEGLELFKKENPDLVLTDLIMPGIDGIQMAQDIRKRNPKVPIILNSVEFNKEVKLRSQKVGINDYLFKDFEKKELIKKVKALLV